MNTKKRSPLSDTARNIEEDKPFIEEVYALAFGEEAHRKGYNRGDVIKQLTEFKAQASNHVHFNLSDLLLLKNALEHLSESDSLDDFGHDEDEKKEGLAQVQGLIERISKFVDELLILR